MLKFPEINPTIFQIGSLEVRWYGLFYIVGFAIAYLFLHRNYRVKEIQLPKDEYETLLFNMMLGVIIGGRIGYVLFYNFSFYLQNPLHIFKVWEGGMSFHGGALGVIAAGLLFCRKYQRNFYRLADPAMPLVSIGLFWGRMGNFINGELYGKPTSLPWGMIFPYSDGKPRHPSQLYEAFLEGIVLFAITNILFRRIKKPGFVFWIWIGLYGVFRFFVEFWREPDAHLGYIWGIMSMGQVLSTLMIISSLIAITILLKKMEDEKS
jgi:phosphatidylglycerol:prolipoprotein diacylglycerol transferase